MDLPSRSSAADWLVGGGAMGELIRSMDWSRTPLGPIDTWPQSLRTTVRIMLDSRFPMFLWWGRELINLYNDGYIPVLGARHPHALGGAAPDIWDEIWDVVGPQAETVLRERRATWNESVLLVMERYGYAEETYFTFSYSPAPDDYGGVGGVFCACTEDTGRVLGERRLRTLRDLGERTMAEADDADAVCRTAAETLAENPRDLPFALIYLLEGGGRTATLRGAAGLHPGSPPSPETIVLGDDDPWELHRVAATRRSRRVEDLEERFGGLPAGPWTDDATRQALVLPLAGPGAQEVPAGFLVAGLSPRLAFGADYRSFLGLAAGQLETALANVHAYEEERKRAEALAEIDRAKTAFFSNVSHEFRTPLTLTLGPLEDALRSDAGVPPALRESLAMAHRNALRLRKLVNSLLDFSRIEAGRALASYEPTDLALLTEDLASTFRSACDRAGLELRVDCEPLPEPVYVDRDMWEKIVLNLLSNAFKFTWEGRIELSLRATDTSAVLRVRDTGVGIPEDELPRLFERFHRVEGTRGRTQEGSGIGLALVHELVKLHGGRIDVASEPGRGTTFTVSVPRGAAHLPAERIGGARTPATAATGAEAWVEEAMRWLPEDGAVEEPSRAETAAVGPLGVGAVAGVPVAGRVLVADDNADMRDYVRRLLAPQLQVQTAADGEIALEMVRRSPPDLVLADVMMPGLDGFGLLRALRADPATRSIPVVLLSARAGEESRVEGLDAGADDYLVKPFSARELLARVDAQLRMAAMRRETEMRFRSMADAAPAMLWVTDETHRCVFLSRSWYDYTGQTEEEALGFGWTHALHPDDRTRSLDIFLRAAERREPFRFDHRLLRRDGAARWAVGAGRPLLAPDGAFIGYIGTVIDVHERTVAEEALREADRRKDEFLATLAHELRNPLAPIRTGLELLKMAPDDHAVAAESLAIMERQTAQLTRLIDDLLDVSRISRGKLQLRRSRVSVQEIVQSGVEAARHAIDAAGHTLAVDLPDEPIVLDADPLRLAQVLSNLLTNAARYTPDGGRIRVSARREGDTLLLAVEDNGLGIPADMRERVFEMFEQIDASEAQSGAGLGIGLTLVRSLVEMHGGSVDVQSEGPGRGSVFRLRLPVGAVSSAQDAPRAGRAAEPLPSAPSRRVLVVDDNPDAARLLCVAVERLGNEVRTARDGAEAVELARTFRPDVVLMDLGMPRMSGYDAARRIREEDWSGDVALVALTGWGQEADRRRTREAGFDHHLVKPASHEALERILRHGKAAR